MSDKGNQYREVIKAMSAPEDGDVDVEELFRKAITLKTHGRRYAACGSVGRRWTKLKLKDTPKCLYRLLYLARPKKVAFDDMYKGGLFVIYSADRRYAVSVELYKYELGLYLYCPPEERIDKQAGQSMRVSSGIPGLNNGLTCSNPEGRDFFEMVVRAANRKWLVYGGNDFFV